MPKIEALLRKMKEVKASDLHIRAGNKPVFRVNKKLRLVKDLGEMGPDETIALAHEIFNEKQRSEFDLKHEVDMSYNIEGYARYRINVFQQKGKVNLAIRLVPAEIKTIEDLDLPESVKKIASENRGLILVTGTTGCGKSTTLAAMINYVNRHFSKHIITIEDPIEFVHKDIKSIVSQRELEIDTLSYPAALKHVVRQDPDVILVGEMRDPETMSAALTAAQTGHLVLSTIHTINAMQTVSRIVDMFPPHQQNQIRLQLADSLCAVISQRLLPRKDTEGMVPALEILVATGLIRSMIEENKITSIPEQIEKGEYYGMCSFNQSLEKLFKEGKVTIEDAKDAATNPEDLLLRIRGIKSESGGGA
ncbi:MAG: type IV pilus twitching motility protein PilT [Elusimicrobia bacterium]|nr:type IV pilus twitching motility protein PilT [Elusimicrobiota bacterium]